MASSMFKPTNQRNSRLYSACSRSARNNFSGAIDGRPVFAYSLWNCEKRLARVLLLLAHFGKEGKHETLIPKMSQETLAEIIGTTRSRVSFVMNRFRKLGFIDYHAGDALQVHSSLLNIVLHD
jgi:CRP-like cAMP-binding protein